jgi:gliding motility-associated-like protein
VAAADDMVITIENQVIVEGGMDQQICSGKMASLNGAATGDYNSLAWSSNGTGSFSDPGILNPDYMPSSDDESAGIVTLSLSAYSSGSCPPATDSLILTFSNPFSVANQIISLNIQEDRSIDLTSGGNFNPGDVIIFSILENPSKGIASLSDKNITYAANMGTVGSDTIEFQACNQCGFCVSGFVLIEILNIPPVIQTAVSQISKGGILSIDLSSLISDLNDNVDYSTLVIISPPVSGAAAKIEFRTLVINYAGINFTGTDQLTIRVCDTSGECTTADLFITVDPTGVFVYNALSPNGDGKHDLLEIQYIESFPENRVKIYNRWGEKVFEISGYDNLENVFTGISNQRGKHELPAGTYYYSIFLPSRSETVNGFFVLNR